MGKRIAHIALVVREYDEAINFFIKKLDFHLIEDTQLSATKRWVLVGPEDKEGFSLLLARAANVEQARSIGKQRAFLFMNTDDFWGDYNKFKQRGIQFIRPPKKEPWGIVAVFEDLYGNKWDLIEPKLSQ